MVLVPETGKYLHLHFLLHAHMRRNFLAIAELPAPKAQAASRQARSMAFREVARRTMSSAGGAGNRPARRSRTCTGALPAQNLA